MFIMNSTDITFIFFFDGTVLDGFDGFEWWICQPSWSPHGDDELDASRYLPGQVPQTEAATADIEKLSLGGEVMGDWEGFMITLSKDTYCIQK